MVDTDIYLTLANDSQAIYRIKNSKFIAIACNSVSELEANGKIDVIRREYNDARHVCYAYRIGSEGILYRTWDDGEPSGTAGKQILGQIISYNLTNIMIAVVRYFGGTLLGTGGLIDAYKTAAKMALENAVIIEKYWTEKIAVVFDAAMMSKVMKLMKDYDARVVNQNFDEQYSMIFEVRSSFADEFRKKLSVYCIKIL